MIVSSLQAVPPKDDEVSNPLKEKKNRKKRVLPEGMRHSERLQGSRGGSVMEKAIHQKQNTIS